MGLTAYLREIFTAIVAITIIALALTVSCQREKIKSHQHNEGELRQHIERLQNDLQEEKNKAAWEAEERRKDERHVIQLLRKMADASAQHLKRMQELAYLSTHDAALRHWLDSPVPDAVRMLFCATDNNENRVCEGQTPCCYPDPLPYPNIQD